ncbi:MAG: hypothetical protein DMF23_16355 [Verrucomicrobia bacterium]|nr:MAG: hypothetical protein DMF23_16355 [Verrucomicrobiota bacterium]
MVTRKVRKILGRRRSFEARIAAQWIHNGISFSLRKLRFWRGWNTPNPHNRSEIESHRNGRRRVTLYSNRVPVDLPQSVTIRFPSASKN